MHRPSTTRAARAALASLALVVLPWPTATASAQDPEVAAPRPVAAPPQISVTEAQLLATHGQSGAPPFWVVTLQHFSTWRHGSNFFFVDVIDDAHLDFYEEGLGLYLEVAPVVSLGRLTGRALAAGPLADVGLTLQMNGGATPAGGRIDRVFLEGVELVWRVPGFQTFNTQLLARQEDGYDPSWQLTWVYGAPFRLGRTQWLVQGFLDVWRRDGNPAGGEDGSTVLLAQPQLLATIATTGRSTLQAGIELELSHAFPVAVVQPDWDLALSPMLRWVF